MRGAQGLHCIASLHVCMYIYCSVYHSYIVNPGSGVFQLKLYYSGILARIVLQIQNVRIFLDIVAITPHGIV